MIVSLTSWEQHYTSECNLALSIFDQLLSSLYPKIKDTSHVHDSCAGTNWLENQFPDMKGNINPPHEPHK